MLCITMEVEPRIAKQYKCQHRHSCKNYQGKGMEGGKKVSLHHEFVEKNWGRASYSTSNKLLLGARRILWASKNVFKVGSVKFANSLSLPSTVKKVRTESKSSQGT